MEQFNTIDGVKKLFESINCIGKENCFFVGYIDIQTSVSLGSLFGGATGAFAAGMAAGAARRELSGYIINQMENGIALIPLRTEGIGFNIKKMVPNINLYTFFAQCEIKNIKIKRANLISAVSKKVVIELNDGNKYNLIVNLKEKYLPYQQDNFAKFMKKYKK
ncbi:MAG: hypothetical protein K6B70_07235 [Clostridia bacterium]|nr:hypothetical protein [Clostridia bacterium]